MVGHVTHGMQENLLKLLMAISEGQGEQAAELVIRISETTDEFNQIEFTRSVCQMLAAIQDQGLEKINIGKSVLAVSENAASNGLYVPAELTLLGKTLLQLDLVGKILDPDFDPNAAIRRNVSELVARHTTKSTSQANVFSSMLEIKHHGRDRQSRD
jgi:predicted unusual protein kinase regulating ubiquinone biosynthesis (AarF/ABC1/UbiB family)